MIFLQKPNHNHNEYHESLFNLGCIQFIDKELANQTFTQELKIHKKNKYECSGSIGNF